jgi:uncharacterized membrane protein
MASSRRARTLATFLAGAGAAHFVVPKFYDAMIPSQLPGSARTWTYGSGVAEIAVAAAVAHPATRSRGAATAAVLFVAVFPGNLKMAIDTLRRDRPTPEKAAVLGRLPLQLPLVAWALRVRRAA